ncbi:hypothetical protein DL96DRAFT_1586739 [Flagelloscypha sp. PMI_526]|nr:hypothetical protein DL96DRAFT_1586739 [Flagelloscypha sp. PMI_526]
MTFPSWPHIPPPCPPRDRCLQYYESGTCLYGDKCPKLHTRLPPTKNRCIQYQESGTCLYGKKYVPNCIIRVPIAFNGRSLEPAFTETGALTIMLLGPSCDKPHHHSHHLSSPSPPPRRSTHKTQTQNVKSAPISPTPKVKIKGIPREIHVNLPQSPQLPRLPPGVTQVGARRTSSHRREAAHSDRTDSF